MQVSRELEEKLCDVNTLLHRANLLCTLEDLGLTECSKLHVSFRALARMRTRIIGTIAHTR